MKEDWVGFRWIVGICLSAMLLCAIVLLFGALLNLHHYSFLFVLKLSGIALGMVALLSAGVYFTFKGINDSKYENKKEEKVNDQSTHDH